MATEDNLNRGSGRISSRLNDRGALVQAYASDPKYKKYAQQVEKCLNSFDSVHEWADFIAFLKQLLKTLQAYMQFKEVPRKIIVAKRLSQCLNPALPSGVHSRALDVYSHILSVVGTEGLKRDLPLWASGLFPFFEYASTSVKPTLLNIYDTYFLALQAGLRPVMKSFILALLPGLEEETGEFFEKVLGLLDRLSGTVSPSFFLQNIWLIMLTTPSARGTSLNFLSRRLPRLNGDEDITSIVGRDIGLMIRAFAAALEDENLLVRRGALDLLLQSLRVDNSAVQKASTEDRAILMRAATSVVMRRDLSLNRRLYTWLLGADENSEQQVAYLRANALDLLRSTLRDEMFSPSAEYSESRPFKIFISLLDKWEIGGPLTEVLIFDTFKALKKGIETNGSSGEDLLMTASTLYEAVEPRIVWRKLFEPMLGELAGDGSRHEAISLVKFILTKFHVRDEEIQTVHLPVVFAALLDIIQAQKVDDQSKTSLTSVSEALQLEEILLQQIPTPALLEPPEIPDFKPDAANIVPLNLAYSFYGIDGSSYGFESGVSGPPLVTVFSNLAKFSVNCAQAISAPTANDPQLRSLLLQCLVLLNRLLEGLNDDDNGKISLDWDPEGWLSTMLTILDEKGRTFALVERIVTLTVSLQRTARIEPNISIQNRTVAFKIVQTLFSYLRPDYAAYHVRAMHLIWNLEHVLKRPYVESVIAQSLTSPESRNIQERYEAFGVFWRLTEDDMLPGFRFRIPMMMVLDTLKNDDPNLRRIGETWMRCSLKSYLRILDPILYDLLDPNLRRTPSVTNLNGKDILDFSYERPFDQSYVNYLLETLLSVVKFGGQGFSKTIRSHEIRRSPHPGMLERIEAAGVAHADATYQDVLIDLLTRFLQSECKHRRVRTMAPFNVVIQSTAIELLQVVISRGDIDSVALEGVEAAVIGKLYLCVHKERLELQNKLLHLLHSIISTTTSFNAISAASKASVVDGVLEHPISRDGSQESGQANYAVNPLLVQTLIDGIGTLSNRPVLQHWLDFILMTIPQFRNHLQTLLPSLGDCVGRQLQLGLSEIQKAASDQSTEQDSRTSTTDAEFVMLLNALERLVLLSLSSPDVGPTEEDGVPAEKPAGAESSGLFGIMNVFSTETEKPIVDEQLTARSPGYRSLYEGVRVLFDVWCSMAWSEPEVWSARDESLALIYTRTRARCRRVFEHLFRVQSAEVLELIIECWSREHADASSQANAAFELVDALTSSAQNVVHMVCESISYRLPTLSDKGRRQVVNPNISDNTLSSFLEQYMKQLEGPLVIQVWGRFLQLAKDILGNSRDFKAQVFPVLRCITVLADKMTQTTAMEDRRIRKDLQDTYSKLLDLAVVSVSRSSEGASWIRRATKDSMVVNGRDSPIPRVLSENRLDEKMAASTASLQDLPTTKPTAGNDQAEQITRFVLQSVLPNLRRFLVDNDKVTVACTNIVYYIVNPLLKGKARPLDIDEVTLGILRELSGIPAALKSWRTIVAEILNDNRFFNSTPESGDQFKPITRAFVDADKTAFSELLGKVTTAPSTNIFANREYENLVRSLNLRRLSYVLACGEKNQFLTSLPTIQEKLVDVLRNVSAPVVQAEVYLCVRVLLCRLSPHNLVSFWPVILTEMYRLLDQVMTSLPADGSEDLPLLLAACKCLDLLFVLQTEEFQVHQWIFITDTVDAVYRPDDVLPEAIFDQLAEIAGRLPVAQGTNQSNSSSLRFPSAVTPSVDRRPMRRPMLNGLRQIDSMRDLVPFFSSVSIASYESVYASGGNIAWDEVEQGIAMDMFEGR